MKTQRKRSSWGLRTISSRTELSLSHVGSTPRTTATGMPFDLPITISAAPASSSAMHTSVTCIVRPRASGVPRRSSTPATPAQPIATSVRPLPPGASERVGDDDADLASGAGADAVADPPSRSIGVERQERGPSPFHVREVDAGVRAHEAVLGLGHDEIAAAPHDPHRFLLDELLVRQRVVGVDGDDTAFGLRHDLLRDDEHVAVSHGGGRIARAIAEIASVMRSASTSPGCTSPMPSTPHISIRDTRPPQAPAATTVSASAPAIAGELITVSATMHRTPSASTASASSRSAASMTSVAAMSA